MRITRLDLPRCSVGEGPVWDQAEQALYYIDILEKRVLRWDPATGAVQTDVVQDVIPDGATGLDERAFMVAG